MNKQTLDNLKQYLIIIIGSFIFTFGINYFIVPVGLYNGGIVGISQIFRTLILNHISFSSTVDISGIINFILNLPLLLIAYKSISKKFFLKTVISVICQTIFFTMIVIPTTPIIDDPLAACLIGGIISGAGIGITLKAGGSGGGIDILGVYFTQKYKNFSVGKLGIIINTIIYSICALLFELPIAIYSIIYTTFFSLIVDKIHYQNINTTAMIFTKKDNVEYNIMYELGRGVTAWLGHGAYTGDNTHILLTVISKYEIGQLRRIVLEKDPDAFIIFNEGLSVTGNFEKRL